MASPRTNHQPSTKDDDDDDDDDKAAQKAWLLAQYEYEDDDEYDSLEEQQEAGGDGGRGTSMTPLQRQLHEMEQEYEQLNAIVVDEAQQYVMSKHEVKSTKKRHKALQKQLEGVRRKVTEQEQARNAQNEANEEEQGGMMDLFGCDNK